MIAFKNFFNWGAIRPNYDQVTFEDPKTRTNEQNEELDTFSEFIKEIFKNDTVSRLQALEMIKRLKRNPIFKKKLKWQWELNNRREVITFIKFIAPYCSIKKPQLDSALELLSLNKIFSKEEKQKIKEQFSEAKLLKNYQAVNLDLFIVTWEGIAGIFDAEGCIMATKEGKSSLTISQKSSLTLLEKIQEFIGHGSIMRTDETESTNLVIYNSQVVAMIGEKILPFLIQKRIQMQIYLYENSSDWRRKIYRILQVLKRC